MLTLILLGCMFILMLGLIGRHNKQVQNFNQVLLQDGYRCVAAHNDGHAFLSFEKAAAMKSTEAMFWCGLIHYFGGVDRPDHRMAVAFWTRGYLKGELSCAVWLAVTELKDKQINYWLGGDKKIIEMLIYVVYVFEHAHHLHPDPTLLLVTYEGQAVAPFKDYLSISPNFKRFYLAATAQQKDYVAYIHAMYVLGNLAKNRALTALKQHEFNAEDWKTALFFLERCLPWNYLKTDLQLASLYETAAQAETPLATLPPVRSDFNYAEGHAKYRTWHYQPLQMSQIVQYLLSLDSLQLWKNALHYYHVAAARHEPQAMFSLGEHYLQGIGVAQDINQAVELFKASGNVQAWFSLGEMFSLGQGVNVDGGQAVDYFTRCYQCRAPSPSLDFATYREAVRYHNLAAKKLRDIYHQGLGSVAPDASLEFKWAKRAAMIGDPLDLCWLAEMYRYGRGTTQDLGAAIKSYCDAVELDNHNRLALQGLYELQQVVPDQVRDAISHIEMDDGSVGLNNLISD